MKTFDYRYADDDRSFGQTMPRSETATKTIPFDYVFEFELTGERGNKVQDVVQISIEGVYVSTSVGYSLVPNEQISLPPVVDQTTILQDPVLIPFFSDADGSDGQRSLNGTLLAGIPGTEVDILNLRESSLIIPGKTIEADGTATIIFDRPIQNAVIRAWDKTNNLLSELFQVMGLDGPVINIVPADSSASTRKFPPSTPMIGPDPTNRKLPAIGDTNVFVYGSPETTVRVFLLEAATGIYNVVENEGEQTDFTLICEKPLGDNRCTGTISVPLKVSTESGIVEKVLSPGDTLLVQLAQADQISIRFSMYKIPRPNTSTLPLQTIASGLERIGANLTRGFRMNPDLVNLAAADLPLDEISPDNRDKIFQTGCSAAEDVSFLYSIDSVGTGREFQSQPIHNIAGLGIANGDRPFRPFAKSIMFEPRSSIRIQIEELSGPPGKLFIVLQGYKILGTGEIPG